MVTCKLGEHGCWSDGKCRATINCENKIVTNADCIRTMSDEELTSLVRAIIRMEDCPIVMGNHNCAECFFKQLCCNQEKYLGCELKWLQQIVEE
jgi:hypothetical protein